VHVRVFGAVGGDGRPGYALRCSAETVFHNAFPAFLRAEYSFGVSVPLVVVHKLAGHARATLKRGIAREHGVSREMLGSVAARAVSTCCKADHGPWLPKELT
jgi:hypothetical protein